MMTLQEKQRILQAKVAAMIRPTVPSVQSSKSAPAAMSDKAGGELGGDKVEENSDIKVSKFGLRPQYSAVNINCDKWLLTMDEGSRTKLENPPSLADGIDRQTEEDLRYLGCELIQSGAILLRLPQTAAATGQILFQRFYYQRSFAVYHFEHAVMACLLLASKIEEEPRRPRDVINVFNRLEQLHRLRQSGRRLERDKPSKLVPRLLDAKYVQTKNMVIKTERRILFALGFVVHVKHPHKLIISYLHTLNQLDNKEICQRAWSYMNDGLRTDMFLRYTPETIACACIFLAARTVTPPVALPSTPYQWFELFDTSDRDVQQIANMLLQLYNRRRVNWSVLNDVLEKAHEKKTGKKATEEKEQKTEKSEKKEEKKERDRRNGRENEENGRRRSRSRSPLGDRKRRKDRDEEEEKRRERREKERRREKEKRARSRERMHKRARETSKMREKEVYQTLKSRSHRVRSPSPERIRR